MSGLAGCCLSTQIYLKARHIGKVRKKTKTRNTDPKRNDQYYQLLTCGGTHQSAGRRPSDFTFWRKRPLTWWSLPASLKFSASCNSLSTLFALWLLIGRLAYSCSPAYVVLYAQKGPAQKGLPDLISVLWHHFCMSTYLFHTFILCFVLLYRRNFNQPNLSLKVMLLGFSSVVETSRSWLRQLLDQCANVTTLMWPPFANWLAIRFLSMAMFPRRPSWTWEKR